MRRRGAASNVSAKSGAIDRVACAGARVLGVGAPAGGARGAEGGEGQQAPRSRAGAARGKKAGPARVGEAHRPLDRTPPGPAARFPPLSGARRRGDTARLVFSLLHGWHKSRMLRPLRAGFARGGSPWAGSTGGGTRGEDEEICAASVLVSRFLRRPFSSRSVPAFAAAVRRSRHPASTRRLHAARRRILWTPGRRARRRPPLGPYGRRPAGPGPCHARPRPAAPGRRQRRPLGTRHGPHQLVEAGLAREALGDRRSPWEARVQLAVRRRDVLDRRQYQIVGEDLNESKTFLLDTSEGDKITLDVTPGVHNKGHARAAGSSRAAAVLVVGGVVTLLAGSKSNARRRRRRHRGYEQLEHRLDLRRHGAHRRRHHRRRWRAARSCTTMRIRRSMARSARCRTSRPT